MEVFDKKRRLFGLINPVDLAAIILAIALAAVLFTVLFDRSSVASDTSSGQDTIEVVVLGSTPSGFNQHLISVGDEVSRFGGIGVMGTVASYTIRPSQREVLIGDSLVIVESDTTNDVELVIRGRGSITDMAASIGDERVRQGQVLEVLLPLFQMSGRIISVEKVD
ncbi:MAG: DUF4330 domain-containing protein [Actinobacteria bacterium]|nr:DUF4330 domain-containing protein [Actinomycetota bacterium]